MSGDILSNHVDEVRGLLQQRLHIKGRSLSHQVGKLGRRVPKRVRRDAEFLVRAETMTQHPKLAQMVDAKQLERSKTNLVTHLKSIDPKEVAKDKLLWVLAKVSFFVIAVFIAAVWFVWDRGMI